MDKSYILSELELYKDFYHQIYKIIDDLYTNDLFLTYKQAYDMFPCIFRILLEDKEWKILFYSEGYFDLFSFDKNGLLSKRVFEGNLNTNQVFTNY